MADNRKPDEVAADLKLTREIGPQYLRAMFGAIEGNDLSESEQRAARAVESAATTWAEIGRFHAKRMADETLTPSARLKASADFAEQKLKRADAEIERAVQAVSEHAQILAKKLGALLEPTPHAGRASIHSDLRRLLRDMPAGERVGFLETADSETIMAIVSAPPALAGISYRTHERLKEKALMNAEPGMAARLQQLGTALDKLATARNQLHAHANRTVDFQGAAAIGRMAS